MSQTSDLPDAAPLPRPLTSRGTPRHVGVEIEFSGITEERAARLLARDLNGAASEDEPGHWVVSGSDLGDFECYLDSRPLQKLDRDGFGAQLRELARSVVPVEVVSDPIEVGQIEALDKALVSLGNAGATGTSSGVLLGFGTHFNPEAVSLDFADVAPVLTAYALIEDHLRRIAGIDLARRLLPWVDPYPRALVDRLAAPDAPADMRNLINTYLEHAPSRNHGLDMLCIFAEIDHSRVARVMDMEQISARPTYHLRLPDCRIDEPGWSLAKEWNRWVLVERVSENPALMARLKAAWRDHRASLTTLRSDWAGRVKHILQEAGL
ncbi:Putative amidoligase enzyme [Salipiger thiooxidans]|uniref:Putative amidoligase enzyme n=1 Tax=Salipiger thiooxidans TaxID=282683 RepID=A0A1G7HJT9_9RHOB|nr:amidoligase family protein [Salipiger thiooxidans]SDF00631.1 Putative amidoligase enzyme [Salipiger thiooxidans]